MEMWGKGKEEAQTVWSTEDGDDGLLMTPVVTFHDELVRPGDQLYAVVGVELRRHVLAERVAGTAWADAPPAALVRVTPEKVAHRTLVWNLLEPVKRSNVVQRIDRWRKPSMQAEDLGVVV